jgi:regulatory protein YycH of two-component signal transduction system YycFG
MLAIKILLLAVLVVLSFIVLELMWLIELKRAELRSRKNK